MRVAIVLTGVGWEAAPFQDPTTEIWMANDGYLLSPPRITRMMEMHRPEDWWLTDAPALSYDVPRGRYVRPTDHAAQLNALGVPVYMQERVAAVPSSRRFPIEAVTEASGHGDLFDSTPAYMVGLALLERAEWIGIYGANMASIEYARQRPNVQWLLGIAVGRGTRVVIGQPSTLLTRTHRYGYEPPPPMVSDGLRNDLLRALNSREQIVNRWLQARFRWVPKGERDAVRAYDDEVVRLHGEIARVGLDATGLHVLDYVVGG